MKKVGIMSMQRIVNYGSFLQAYGLKQILESLGYSVEFVDYHVDPPIINSSSEKSNPFIRKFHKGLEVIKGNGKLSHKITYIKYKNSFAENYFHYLGVTKEYNYLPELDCLVIGSDEVFNCIQSNTNVGYSLELFGKNNKAEKLITYAASFGNTTLDKLEKYGKKEEILSCLKGFDLLSVRDENSSLIVNNLTGKSPVINIDPVLAYDYINRCKLIPDINISEKYLLLYAYSDRISDEESKWIRDYAKLKGLKIYTIGGVQKYADKLVSCSPFEVLAYFLNASEVITDTFHGSIFSIITHRQFTTIVRKSQGGSYGNEEKIKFLLNSLGLSDRMTFDVNNTSEINKAKINYSVVDDIITKERQKTIEYLSLIG